MSIYIVHKKGTTGQGFKSQPGHTSRLGVEEPGQTDEKWATGTNGYEMRIGNCWNVIPVKGVTRGGFGT